LDGTEPASGQAQVLELKPIEVQWQDMGWQYSRTWTVTIPPQPAGTLLRYHLTAHKVGTDEWIFADNQATSIDKATDFSLWIDNDPIPEWSRQAIVYHVFLDRFYPGNGRKWNQVKGLGDFFGGTIRGVIDKLEYIQNLGFNTIWLSPFFKTNSHHGYNASDYYTVEPRLGTNADLKELIEAAHGRGLRLLLDFVANHWSKDHPSFQEALADENSPYHDWYTWKKWPDEYERYFNVRELPKINLTPGPAREYMLEVARYWLREGFDGYRLDFAYGPDHDFWVDFRRACREVKPDSWIFGEVVHTPEIQRSYAGIMDGTLDFHLARALRETFALERMPLNEFEGFLSNHETYFPADFSRPSFLDNHDMSRFLYMAGDNKDKLKLAALVLFSLSGPPIVYNGTECGVSQERPMQQGSRYVFEEARMPMKWGQEADDGLIDYFRQLAQLRRDHPALSRGRRSLTDLDPSTGIYGFLREDDAERTWTVVNLSAEPHIVILPESLPVTVRDQLGGLSIRDRRMELPPYGGAFVC
jgi:glycosidase